MAKITCLLPSALGIDEDRQIAAQSHRVHGLEEKGAMPAEQILHIVFGRHDQDIDPGLVHHTAPRRLSCFSYCIAVFLQTPGGISINPPPVASMLNWISAASNRCFMRMKASRAVLPTVSTP